MKKIIKRGISVVVLAAGTILGFSGLLLDNAKTTILYSIQKTAATENQRISDSLTSLYNVPKAHADSPHTGAGCSCGDGGGCGGGCCGCGDGCSGCCG